MIRKLTLFLPLFVSCFMLQAQNDTLSTLFRNSYRVFELQRNDTGVYRDSKLFNPHADDYHPASVANIGMGLIALCIADTMEWVDDAEEQILLTLRTLAGKTPAYNPARNASGFFCHFIDMGTGACAWNSEYSSIDTGILMSGALFAKKYFPQNDSIAYYTELLWDGIDWSKTIANPQTGEMFRDLAESGEGVSDKKTSPFNEYMIVAWLAMNAEKNNPGIATELWNNFYANTENLPTREFENIPLLTDHPSHHLSHFVFQFPYYLCHPFTVSPSYLQEFKLARKADSLWWDKENVGQSYQWGLGAGSANYGSGYHADAINDNSTHIHSPHIIGGFLPIYADGKDDLLAQMREGSNLYTLPTSGTPQVLWRKSLDDPNWNAGEIQGIDYSTMLFGLAALPEYLGPDFFPTYNDFDFPPFPLVNVPPKISEKLQVDVFPLPVKTTLNIRLKENINQTVEIKLQDISGRTHLFKKVRPIHSQHKVSMPISHLPSGIWILMIEYEGKVYRQKIVKL